MIDQRNRNSVKSMIRRIFAGISLLAASLLLPVTACNSTQGTGGPRGGPPVADTVRLLPPEPPPERAEHEFRTDFSRHTVSYAEIFSGGPPRDGIPSIDRPRHISVAEADTWLRPEEQVIWAGSGNDARAYPVQVIVWHEIVNDTLDGLPVAVTYCPLCNTAIVFNRKLGDTVIELGTTGRLRFSNMVMYDRQTESWWQQGSGDGIAGFYAGRRLEIVPASIIPWSEFKAAFPNGKVLSRETGLQRPYGKNPYASYDDIRRSPHLYQGPEIPRVLPALARVIGVEIGGEAVAYPYGVLEKKRVINDRVGTEEIVIFWDSGAASPLEAEGIAEGRDVGAAVGFSRIIDGRTLTFKLDKGMIVDEETKSRWTLLGRATSGPLAGRVLTPINAINHFWFSWSVFKPGTRVYKSDER